MAALAMKHISAGKDGGIWAVGKSDGTIYRLYGDAGAVGWVADKEGKAEVIAAVNWAELWCVNKAGEIWHLTDSNTLDKGGVWTQVPIHSGRADARTIGVGNDGSVWYAQTDGTLFHKVGPGAGWVQDKAGKAVVLAPVNAADVYCINKDGQIWFAHKGE